ncbi:MAG TPA: GtrA family protein [Candidatus Faecousia intestinigallinarum]|nr:GtrA family protein [Candidatus Faecousia intestinigallinarum]
MEKLTRLLKKHWDILSYLFFGVLTTLVNYAVYLPLYNWAGLSGAWSNVIAWAVSVLFAYLTNKPFVFRSHDWSVGVVIPELSKFVGCRIGSGAVETGMVWLLVDILRWNGNIVKLAASIFVVIANYAASKLLVFRKK